MLYFFSLKANKVHCWNISINFVILNIHVYTISIFVVVKQDFAGFLDWELLVYSKISLWTSCRYQVSKVKM